MKYLVIGLALLALPLSARAGTSTADALQRLRPNAEWTMDGDSYEGLNWLDTKIDKPTKQEVAAEVRIVEIIKKRRAEYPPLQEKVDALLEGGQALADIKKRVEDINRKYPLP